MRERSTVGDDRHVETYSLESVPNHGRDGNQAVIIRAREKFLHLSACRTVRSIVIKHELDVAVRHRIIERHLLVNVPGLDGARIHTRKVNLSESREVRRIASQHVHDLAALIKNLSEGRNDDTIYHVLFTIERKSPYSIPHSCRR